MAGAGRRRAGLRGISKTLILCMRVRVCVRVRRIPLVSIGRDSGAARVEKVQRRVISRCMCNARASRGVLMIGSQEEYEHTIASAIIQIAPQTQTQTRHNP